MLYDGLILIPKGIGIDQHYIPAGLVKTTGTCRAGTAKQPVNRKQVVFGQQQLSD